MKQLKKDLQAVSKEIKRLTQKADKMIKQLEKLEKTYVPMKTKTRKTNKMPEIDPVLARIIREKIRSTDIVLAHILANSEGIDINTLEKKTGFKHNTIKQIIYRLKGEGKVRSQRKEGLRGKAYAAGMSRTLYFRS